MDFITDLPPGQDSKATILLVITYCMGKGSILFPVHPSKFDAESIALLFVEQYIPFHCIPKAIGSDCGTQFVNTLWTRVCQLLNINQHLSTAYHPETNGETEQCCHRLCLHCWLCQLDANDRAS